MSQDEIKIVKFKQELYPTMICPVDYVNPIHGFHISQPWTSS